MHILHFMNVPLSLASLTACGKGIRHAGGWMAALITEMLKRTDHKFTCAAFDKHQKITSTEDGRVVAVTIPYRHGLKGLIKIIDEQVPDLIHIHGTEGPYGLVSAKGLTNIPVIIGLQGLLGPCSKWNNFFAEKNIWHIARMHRLLEFPALRGLLLQYLKYKKTAKRELEIIKGNRFFIGRTDWDRSYIHFVNPRAKYFYGGELLRDPFWQGEWQIKKIKRYRLIFTNAGRPYKGAELLLDAVDQLSSEYPEISVALAGYISKRSGYGRYIRRISNKMSKRVSLLGQLTAEELTQEMLQSHIFISPTFSDNSPNALCEAQLLGMPVISSYTGGIPSLVRDGVNGLFFPKGEVFSLTDRIRKIFDDDDLATMLGRNAKSTARERHDPEKVVKDIQSAYKAVAGVKNA